MMTIIIDIIFWIILLIGLGAVAYFFWLIFQVIWVGIKGFFSAINKEYGATPLDRDTDW